MRPRLLDRPVPATAAALASTCVVLTAGCSASPGDGAATGSGQASPPATTTASASPSPSSASGSEESRLEATDVPFTEPVAPGPRSSDVPATLYTVLSENLDPREERLAAYDGSNDPATGVGAGQVRGGWSLNAEWRPRGLVGVLVAPEWPEGWLCVDSYPGCREVEVDGAGTAQALPTGRNQVSVGFEQPGGTKVVLSAVRIDELSVADLASAAADDRLDLP